MSYSLTIDTRNAASGPLAELRQRLESGQGAAEGAGEGVVECLKENFRSLEERGNAKGWRSSHFYRDAGSSTKAQVLPEGVVVDVWKVGVAQRLHGGPINARDRLLAYPAIEDAAGKAPGEWTGLKFGWALNPEHDAMQRALIARETGSHLLSKSGRQKYIQAPGEVVYWLASHVNQKPNPAVIPSEDKIVDAATAGAGEAIQAAVDRAGWRG